MKIPEAFTRLLPSNPRLEIFHLRKAGTNGGKKKGSVTPPKTSILSKTVEDKGKEKKNPEGFKKEPKDRPRDLRKWGKENVMGGEVVKRRGALKKLRS